MNKAPVQAASGFSYSRAEFEELVDTALAHARSLGASDAGAEASEGCGLSVSVRKGELETVERNRDKSLGVTVYVGARRGNASTSDFSRAAIERTVQAAYDIARFTAQDPVAGLPELEDIAPQDAQPDLDLFHPWELTSEQAAELALRCERAAFDTDPRITNSEGAGVSAQQRASPESIGRYAAERALARLKSRKIRTRECPVLFESPLAAGLLGGYVQATSGGALYRKSTFLIDSLGKKVFADHIDVLEDPLVRRGKGSAAFDE